MQKEITINNPELLKQEKFVNERKTEENAIQNNINKYPSINNDKEYQNKLLKSQFLTLTDRERSSDSTSISLSQIESLSQSSESSKFISLTNNSQEINSNGINKNDLLQEGIIIKFFKETEDYFSKIMPECFSEYKKSKNYLPKSKFLEKEDIEQKISENQTLNEEYKVEENKFNNCNNLSLNNLYYPVYLFQFNSYYNNHPSFNKGKNVDNYIKKKKEINKNNNSRFLENYRENSKDEIEDDDNVYIIVKQNNFKNHHKNKEKIQKNIKEISKECNFLKNNYNSNYSNTFIQNYNYKFKNHNYNSNKNYNYNYNKECSFTDDNHNEHTKFYYNKNNNYCKRTRKTIYY